MSKIKKLISIALSVVLVVSATAFVDVENININDSLSLYDYMVDEKILSDATVDDNFCDSSVIIIQNLSASRDNRDITAREFIDIGAVDAEDVVRLSDEENAYAQELWRAEREYRVSGSVESTQSLAEARELASENTLVNFDQFRRIIEIKLDKNCKENVLRVIRELESREDIRWVGPKYIMPDDIFDSSPPHRLTPNDPLTNQQWAINHIKLPEAWAITTGSSTVNVGIIDSGIRSSHEDLRNRINRALSRDFAVPGNNHSTNPNLNNVVDPSGHGTRVAGVIGAQGNNGIGISGVAWDIRLVSLRVHDNDFDYDNLVKRNAYFVAVASAVNHARLNNIPILNASLSYIGYANSENQAVRDAVQNYGGLFVQSAGNYNSNTNNNPRFGGFPNVIVVGASTQSDIRWAPRPGSEGAGSNYGTGSVHLFAPSAVTSILTTSGSNDGNYLNDGQTSMATPHVAGVAALILSAYPQATTQQIKWAILNGADTRLNGGLPVGTDLTNLCITGGRLNAYGALRAMASLTDTTFGVHHIKNVQNNRYLNLNNIANNQPVTLTPTKNNADISQRWFLRRLDVNNFFEIRNMAMIGGQRARIIRNTSNGSVISTSTTNQDVGVRQNSDGSVTFWQRSGNQTFLLASNTAGTQATWVLLGNVEIANINPTNLQKWRLESISSDAQLTSARIANGWYNIQHSGGRFVRTAGNSSNERARLELWNTPASFHFQHMGDGYYRIRTSFQFGHYLEVEESWTHDSAPIQAFRWENGFDTKLWRLVRKGDFYMLVNKNSGKVMDFSPNTVDNPFAWQWSENNESGAQLFRLNAT
jgi:hypothetical protein